MIYYFRFENAQFNFLPHFMFLLRFSAYIRIIYYRYSPEKRKYDLLYFFYDFLFTKGCDSVFTILRSGYFVYRTPPENVHIPLRTAKSYELELVTTDGSQTYYNGEILERKAGMFILTHPGQKRRNFTSFECHYIHFTCDDEEFIQKYLSKLPPQICPADIKLYTEQFIQIDALCSKMDFPEEHRLMANTLLTQILLNLYLSTQNISTSAERYTQYAQNISTACSYIGKHFNENITIEDISRAAALSPSFTYVVFRELTGQTPHAYLLNTRIDEAKRQLVYTKKSVAQISTDCGFKEANYLNYIFRKHLDITPKQYRVQHQNNMF